MFDVGFQELTLIGLIALIVVGPERLPRMARTLGLWTGRIRYYVGQVKSDIEREVRAQELKEMLDKPARELDELKSVAAETKDTLDQARSVLGEAKTAFDGAAGDVSSPGEPAAGSIFPTELPEVGPAPKAPAPAETASASSTSLQAAVAAPAAEPGEAVPASPPDASPAAAAIERAARPEPDEAAPHGIESGRPDTSSVATNTRESDEQSSERV